MPASAPRRSTTIVASLANDRPHPHSSLTSLARGRARLLVHALLLIDRGVSRFHGARDLVKGLTLLGDGWPNYLHTHAHNNDLSNVARMPCHTKSSALRQLTERRSASPYVPPRMADLCAPQHMNTNSGPQASRDRATSTPHTAPKRATTQAPTLPVFLQPSSSATRPSGQTEPHRCASPPTSAAQTPTGSSPCQAAELNSIEDGKSWGAARLLLVMSNRLPPTGTVHRNHRHDRPLPGLNGPATTGASWRLLRLSTTSLPAVVRVGLHQENRANDEIIGQRA